MLNPQSLPAPVRPEPAELSVDVRGGPARIALYTLTLIKGASCTYRGCMRAGDRAVDVAVRVFEMTFSDNERRVQAREIEALRRLEHPGILAVYGECRLDRNHMAIVLPFMTAGNLDDATRTLAHDFRLNILVEVAEALVYLHTIAYIVHGDLKPSNVLLSQFGSALLTGFKFRECVTLRYAAPELLLDQDLDAASPGRFPRKTSLTDIYAFGCLTLAVMSETAPWGRLHDMTILRNMAMGMNIPRPHEGKLTDIEWEICKRCCARLPGERPTAVALASSLRRITQCSGVSSRVMSHFCHGPPGRCTRALGSPYPDWVVRDARETAHNKPQALYIVQPRGILGGGIRGVSLHSETRAVDVTYVVIHSADLFRGTGWVKMLCGPEAYHGSSTPNIYRSFRDGFYLPSPLILRAGFPTVSHQLSNAAPNGQRAQGEIQRDSRLICRRETLFDQQSLLSTRIPRAIGLAGNCCQYHHDGPLDVLLLRISIRPKS